MAVEVSRPTQQHLDRTGDDGDWWLPIAFLGCVMAVLLCAALALAL